MAHYALSEEELRAIPFFSSSFLNGGSNDRIGLSDRTQPGNRRQRKGDGNSRQQGKHSSGSNFHVRPV
jgi:hypothetical protein